MRHRPVHVSPFQLGGLDFVVLSAPLAPLPKASLTKAEQAVVALVVAGLSNSEIADKRGTSVHTVSNQLAAIFRKTGVGSRVELASRFNGLP
jgi:DNA-binding CsgD family transcriptional regulator